MIIIFNMLCMKICNGSEYDYHIEILQDKTTIENMSLDLQKVIRRERPLP